jgi:hypothetical protein
MRYVDFTVQTLFIVVALAIVGGSFFMQDWLTLILLLQFMLGLWQLTSSFLSVIKKSGYYKLKEIHLILSLGDIILILVIGVVYKVVDLGNAGSLLIMPILFVIPWCLAMFYYWITLKCTFSNRRRGSFLPNLSF